MRVRIIIKIIKRTKHFWLQQAKRLVETCHTGKKIEIKKSEKDPFK